MGTQLRELREKAGLSQKELAEIFDVDRSTVNKWEAGTSFPNVSLLRRIADYFHVTTDYLLGRPEPGRDEAAAENGQKEKPSLWPEPKAGVAEDGLSEDERTILELLRQVPDEDLPATHRAIKALLAGMRDGE